jgi:cbb3-type cytochrome oxidase cytochrome c subunit
VPYTSEDIAAAGDAVRDRNEMDALIAYMQGLKFLGAPPSTTESSKGQQ